MPEIYFPGKEINFQDSRTRYVAYFRLAKCIQQILKLDLHTIVQNHEGKVMLKFGGNFKLLIKQQMREEAGVYWLYEWMPL